ncbi:MAG TPA: hypothetical protein V6D17_09735 [Candidatus Obscuribacterales bacterium]
MRELAVIEKLELEAGMNRFKDVDIDRLIDGLEPWERELQKDYEREFGNLGREGKESYDGAQMTDEMKESLRDHGLDWLTGGNKGRDRGDDSWETFESDRQVREQERTQDDDREERDRGGDFGRGR